MKIFVSRRVPTCTWNSCRQPDDDLVVNDRSPPIQMSHLFIRWETVRWWFDVNMFISMSLHVVSNQSWLMFGLYVIWIHINTRDREWAIIIISHMNMDEAILNDCWTLFIVLCISSFIVYVIQMNVSCKWRCLYSIRFCVEDLVSEW